MALTHLPVNRILDYNFSPSQILKLHKPVEQKPKAILFYTCRLLNTSRLPRRRLTTMYLKVIICSQKYSRACLRLAFTTLLIFSLIMLC